ncbi:MAG: lysylphosphatidylglycerol synthase transmembrane domain-containing protein [Coriobacteriia bacterium]|nr:lysylphosphatidylglycerol synthase transmembrane domain-containing protein [Coriobacteriia bacterium]
MPEARPALLGRIWRVVRLLVALALVAVLARVAGAGDLLKAGALDYGWLAFAAALIVPSVWVRAYNHGLLLNSHERLLSSAQLFRLTLIGAGIALVLPLGAADLLKARWGLVAHGHAEEMVISSVFDKLTSLTALAVMGVVGALATGDLVLAAVSATVMVGTLVPLAVPTRGLWRLLLRVLAPRAELDESIVARQARPAFPLLLRVWAVSLGAWVLTYVVVYASCRAVGAPVELLTVFAVAPLATISRLIPVSAGGIGVGEATLAALLVRSGVAADLAAQVALVQLVLLVLLPGLAGAVLLAMAPRPGSVPPRP